MIAKRAAWTVRVLPTTSDGVVQEVSVAGYIQGFVPHPHYGTVAIMLVVDIAGKNRQYVDSDFVEVPLKDLQLLLGG